MKYFYWAVIIITVLLVAASAHAATVLFPFGGGTGTSTAPGYGQLLVGNSGGTYSLMATSSLGISGGGGNPVGASSTIQYNANGAFAGNTGLVYTGTRLGIGTTTPTAKLEITDSVAPTIRLSDGTARTVELRGAASGQAASVGTLYNAAFGIITTNTQRLTVDGSGNVGIGTTTPNRLFSLDNAGLTVQSFNLAGTEKTVLGTGGSAGTGFANFAAGDTFIRSTGNLLLGGSYSGSSVNSAMTITGTNVGIGTTTPSSSLDIDTGAATTLPIITLGAAGGNLTTIGRASASLGGALLDLGINVAGTNNFYLGAGGNAHLFMSGTTGNIGLGTTNPGATLEAVGTVRASRSGSLGQWLQLSSDSLGLELTASSTNNGKALYIQNQLDSGGLGGQIMFQTGATLTNRLVITPTGNIGIGSTTPNQKLVVAGNESIQAAASNTGIFADNASGAGMFSLTRQAGVGPDDLSISAYSGIGFTGGFSTYQSGATAYQMYLSSAGNLGIGTTTPAQTLTVDTTSTVGTTFTLANGSTGGHIYTFGSSGSGNAGGAGNFFLSDTTAGSRRLAIDAAGDVGLGGALTGTGVVGANLAVMSNGKVGIGTTTPQKLLSVGTGNAGTFMVSTSTAGCAQFSSIGEMYATGSACGSGTVTSVAATVPTGLTVSGTPITTSGTLAFGWDTGYGPVLTASTTNWNTFYNAPSSQISAGLGLSWSGNTLGAASGYSIPLTASTTDWNTAFLNRITSATAPLSISGNAISIAQANTSTSGYLSNTDWNTFNGKQAALTFSYPLVNTANTITLAFGTTTANTWSGLQKFTNAGTTTFTGGVSVPSLAIGSLTGVVRAVGGYLTTGLVNLASDVTGVLGIANGGTGQSTNTKGDILAGTGSIWAKLGIGTDGQVLTASSTATDGMAWAAASGGNASTTIASGSLSGNAVTITSIPNTYASLTLVISGASHDTSSRAVRVLVSTDNGSSYDNSSRFYQGFSAVGSTLSTLNDGLTPATVLSSSGNVANITVNIPNYTTGQSCTTAAYSIPGASNTTANVCFLGDSLVGTTAPINALEIILSGTGNFDAGTYTLYGFK